MSIIKHSICNQSLKNGILNLHQNMCKMTAHFRNSSKLVVSDPL
jgi:hypothetical protein